MSLGPGTLSRISIKFPFDLVEMSESDVRSTFRRTMENRLRRRMNELRDRVAQATRFPSVASQFAVRAQTTEDSYTIMLVNTNENYKYMIRGSQAHVIVQRPHVVPLQKLLPMTGGNVQAARFIQSRIAAKGVRIRHPGVRQDADVVRMVNSEIRELWAVAKEGAERWAQKYGREAV